MIREELSRFYPYPILGEEYGRDTQDAGHTQNDEFLWCIDPIDGTTNFYHRLPFYAISIALLRHMTSQVGVVYQPQGQKLYYSELGKGAFLNGVPISVSNKSNPAEAILLINHGYHQSDMERSVAVIQRLGLQFETRHFGATALELAWLAQGLADAFLCSGDELWDYAAGILLIREAGGQVTDWHGHHFNSENSFMCASNGIFHPQLIDAVQDLQ